MANNDSATPITTGSEFSNLKKYGIYYFQLDPEKFIYSGETLDVSDERNLCGLNGAEIDSNFHFLSGFDIKSVEFGESGSTIVITRANDNEFSAITLSLTDIRPTYRFDQTDGCLYVKYPEKEEEKAACGFFVDFNDEGKYNVKVYTDGTIDGLGTEFSPLSLSRLERTGTYAPVETLVESGSVEDYKGKRVLSKELIDDYGHLYNYDEVEAIQAALEVENSPWRVATKADWDELLNAMEGEEEYRTHDDCVTDRIDRFHGEQAGGVLKAAKYWRADTLNQDDSLLQKSVGFNALPVGCRPYRSYSITDPENDIEGFGEITGFWALKSSGDTCPEGNPFIKFLCYQYDGVSQKRPPEDDGYSVRLVRECVEGCPEQYETILGSSYPVGPITSPCGVEYCKIWTLSNFYSVGNGFEGYVVDGENVPKLDKYAYFINECDGKKKRMMEGESVVILDRCRHEWRIIDGELVDTYEEVREDLAALSGDLITYIDEFSAGTVSEIERLDNEILRLSGDTDTAINNAADAANTRIAVLTETTNTAINLLSSNTVTAISELSEETDNAINDLTTATERAITSLSAATVHEIERLDSKIEDETTRAMEAEVAERDRATQAENELAYSIAGNSATITNIQRDLSESNEQISHNNDLITELSGSVINYHNQSVQEVQAITSSISTNVEAINTTANGTIQKLEQLSGQTENLYDLLIETINETDAADEEILNTVAATSARTLNEAKEYTDEQVDAINAVKVNDLYFDNLSKYIKLIKADGSLTDGIPAEEFLKDSVLTRVEYDEGNERLVFVWNDDDTTRTYIPLAKLSNVYGIASDSLAYLKMSGTNLSAIVDKADGFERTLATTKFVEDAATEAQNEAIEFASGYVDGKIEILNGDKTVPGSVAHALDDKFNTSLLTAGLPVTNVSVDEASNHSLLRTIVVNGEVKYFVSNNAKDMLATDKDGYTQNLNHYINTLENKITALENENASLKTRVAILENRVDDIAATGIDETMVRNIVKAMLVGTDREIKISETGELGQKLQIGFADNAVFGEEL